MTRATITSWKTLPPPERREPLDFAAEFTDAETDHLVFGLIPKEMQDKWFICFHQGWLLFHRSWTGACIYSLRLEAIRGGARVADSWVNRDPAQYTATDVEYDRKLVRFLVDALLLRREAIFPLPAGVESAPPGAYQHSVVGRAYPESAPEPAPEIPAKSQAK
jgi:hypothetical protein